MNTIVSNIGEAGKSYRLLTEKLRYSCSHGLRGPISSIKGLVTLAQHYPNHHETASCLKMMAECLSKLDKLVHTFEEYLANNNHNFSPELIDCSQLAEQVINEYEPQLTQNRIQVTTEINTLFPVVGDKYGISRIVKYLFSNSVAFYDPAKKTRKIHIVISDTREMLHIEIIDNGVGIRDDVRTRIQNAFSKGISPSKNWGTGLFLAHHLIENLGGEMHFSSEEGLGTHFKVNIPNWFGAGS